MTKTNEPQNTPAPQEIDPAALDDVVGAGLTVRDTLKNEESVKLRTEERHKQPLK